MIIALLFCLSKKHDPQPPAPFKFNPVWLKEEGYKKLIMDSWMPLQPDQSVSFMKQIV